MDPAQLQPGHRLDRYELLCPLAYGGMASVWLARFGGRKGFERLVVVKMILPQYAQDPRFQEMFVDEARIASRIEHANVARILDVGEQGEGEHGDEGEQSTYIVMEWVDGDSLSKVARAAEAKKQRVPAGVSLRVCADAAAGLHAAHILKERDGTLLGVVHRDVSPQNILISSSGTTVLIDFGVAKARDRVSQETSAGQLKGKIRYMAPEQALGRNLDHRADVWALGAILYELFAGVPPYDGPNEVATLHKLTSGAAPQPLPAHVPPPVRAVINRALSYDPEERYATALELNLALETCMIEIGEPTTSAVVAHYTGHLLADRKAARKRAVDTALSAAHARDAERSSSGRSGTSTSAPVSMPANTLAPISRVPPGPPPVPYPASSSRLPGQMGPLGQIRHASQPSQASQPSRPSQSGSHPSQAGHGSHPSQAGHGSHANQPGLGSHASHAGQAGHASHASHASRAGHASHASHTGPPSHASQARHVSPSGAPHFPPSPAHLLPPPPPPSGMELASQSTSPSNGPLGFGGMGLGEVPSATSSTLGSAAMEYPPELVEDPNRRRRFVAAAILGVSVAAGVVGAVLIISTALLKRDGVPSTGASSSGPPPPTTQAMPATASPPPPEATDPPPSPGMGAAPAIATGAMPASSVVAAPSATATTTATTATTATTPTTAPTATTAAATAITAPATPPPHRPTFVAPAAPKPAKTTTTPPVSAPTTPKAPDRGF